MITPSFNLTATERVLPRLALDFTTANLDLRVTFTRTGDTATVTNSSGYIVPINANLPRFDFNPVTLLCNGLLIEESRQNRLLYSEQFNQSPWANVRSSVSPNVSETLSPSGLNTADKLVENTVDNNHYIVQDFANTSNTVFTVTVYAKAAERRFLRVVCSTTGNANSQFANFDLLNGTVGTPSGGSGITGGSDTTTWVSCNGTDNYLNGMKTRGTHISCTSESNGGGFETGFVAEDQYNKTAYILCKAVNNNGDGWCFWIKSD